MFGLVVRFDLHDESAARGFDTLVGRTVPAIAASEPDTILYAVHRVDDAPLSRIFYEVYRDKGAFDFHEVQSHTVKFLAEREQYIRQLRVEFLNPVQGMTVSHE